MEGSQQVSHSEHVVTLFDSETSRAVTIARFILEARSSNQPVVVVATAAHWNAIVRAAGPRAGGIVGGLADGSIAFCDAEVALSKICRGGLPNRARFDAFLTDVFRALPGGTVHVYGELVDLLAARNEFDAVVRLEQLWNDFAAKRPMRLLCGYDATVFGPHSATRHLRSVCACHLETRMGADDTLGRWLLEQADLPISNAREAVNV